MCTRVVEVLVELRRTVELAADDPEVLRFVCYYLVSAHEFNIRSRLRPSSFVPNQRISVSPSSQSMSRPSPKLLHLTVSVPADIKGRRRSGSIVKVEEVGGRTEELLDRSAYLNINANWVNAKGA